MLLAKAWGMDRCNSIPFEGLDLRAQRHDSNEPGYAPVADLHGFVPVFCGPDAISSPAAALGGELGAGALRWPRVIPTAVGGRHIIVEQLTPA